MSPSSSLDFGDRLINPICDAIGCEEEGIFEKEITVRDMLNQPFTFTAFFCERHSNDDARTIWHDKGLVMDK
jgi:hypothetical protein